MGNELFYAGFLDLTADRNIGFGVGPIPMTAILDYCLGHGIFGEQQEDFIWFIQRLDKLYLDWSRDRGGKKSD